METLERKYCHFHKIFIIASLCASDCCQWCDRIGPIYWNVYVINLTNFSSLAAPEVVNMTSSCAASDENFIKMATFIFQCLHQHGASLGCSIICKSRSSWWRHQMETFSVLLVLCTGNSQVTGEFPSQRPVTRSFDVFFDLRPNKQLSKQSRRRWFETPLRLLWRHCNAGRKLLWSSQSHFHVNTISANELS